jgi:uncharacterized protein
VKWDLQAFIENAEITDSFLTKLDFKHIKLTKNRFVKVLEPISLNGMFVRVDEEVWIRGNIECKYQVKCDRCLDLYDAVVEAEIEAQIVKDADLIEPFDDTKILYQNGNLNIEEAVERAIVVQFPMKNLCSDDCEGICPKCGINLNHSKCTCEKEEGIDIRLFELTKFEKR